MTAITDQGQYECVTFTRLTIEGRTFIGVDFTACVFDHCTFTECTFSPCSFTEYRFTACDLSLAAVPGTRFTDVEFATSKLVGIDWTKAGDAVWTASHDVARIPSVMAVRCCACPP